MLEETNINSLWRNAPFNSRPQKFPLMGITYAYDKKIIKFQERNSKEHESEKNPKGT